jgi:hypothetical protein
MTRDLSLTLREAINAQESGEVPIFLVTIDHDEADEPILLSSDPTERVTDVPLVYGTTSNGDFYQFVPMSLPLPDESDEAAPRTQIRISHINREVAILARSVTTPGTAQIKMVLASSPDDVEVETPVMDILAATLEAGELTLDLGLNSMMREPFPADNFDPAGFPGLHI